LNYIGIQALFVTGLKTKKYPGTIPGYFDYLPYRSKKSGISPTYRKESPPYLNSRLQLKI
jgi:hypothetical protein